MSKTRMGVRHELEKLDNSVITKLDFCNVLLYDIILSYIFKHIIKSCTV